MAFSGEKTRSLGGLESERIASMAQNRGVAAFSFQIPVDSNAAFFQCMVSCEDALKRGRMEPVSPIRSARIPILAWNNPKVLRFYDRPAWQNVMQDALETGYWREKRGDPTVIGWAITIFYVVAGLLCLYCTGFLDARRAFQISRSFAWFWWLVAVLLILLGINKQLDVQLLLADVGRAFTKHQGWYGQRKPVQIRVLALGACAILACLQEVGFRLKRGPKSNWFALCGLFFLAGNVLIHLVSLHSIGNFLGYSLVGLSMGEGFEILAILCITVSAFVYNQTHREEVNYIIQ